MTVYRSLEICKTMLYSFYGYINASKSIKSCMGKIYPIFMVVVPLGKVGGEKVVVAGSSEATSYDVSS